MDLGCWGVTEQKTGLRNPVVFLPQKLSRSKELPRVNHINRKPPLRRSDSRWTIQCLTRSTLGAPSSNLSPRGSGPYWLLGGSPVLIYFAGAGVTFEMTIRFFQTPPSRTAIDA